MGKVESAKKYVKLRKKVFDPLLFFSLFVAQLKFYDI